MDVQDRSKTGHESHGVHLCHRCGWPFPNAHPSARHRRAHKKICGTIEGYTNMIDSGVVSDDEHHPDEDLEKTPSPMVEKKNIKEGSVGMGQRSSRSEEDLFSDAVTEFSDIGTSPGLEDRSGSNKSLDRDLFFSFKDAENGDVLNNPIEISKPETLDTHLEKLEETEIDSTGVKFKETQTSDAVPITVIEEAKDADIQTTCESVTNGLLGEDDNGEKEKLEGIKHEKFESDHEDVSEVVKESEIDRSGEVISEEIKGEKFEYGRERVSEVVKESGVDQGEELEHEKLESDHGYVSEVVKESGVDEGEEIMHGKLESGRVSEVVKESGMDQGEETKNEKLESDDELVSEVVEESRMDQSVETKHEKLESDHDHVSEVVKGSEADEGEAIKLKKLESDDDHVSEFVKESEIDEGEELMQEKLECGDKLVSEGVKEPETDQSEEIKHAESESVLEHAPEVNKESGIVEGEETKQEKLESNHEHVSEVFKEPQADQGAEIKREHALELVKESGMDQDKETKHEKVDSDQDKEPETNQTVSVLTQKGDDLGAPKLEICSKELEEPSSVSTKNLDLGAPECEKGSNEHTQELIKESVSVLTEKEDLDASNSEKCEKDPTPEAKSTPKNVFEPLLEQENHKSVNNQESSAALSVDSSSQNSVDGNWGSVSVLSTASMDESKVNLGKPVVTGSQAGAPEVFEPPSFMTLVETKGDTVDQKPVEPSKPEPPQAGWFPSVTNVSNESEGRKRNEEVIAKVTNWTTGKHSLKNLLGEAKLPSAKPAAPVAQKEEGPVVNQDSSPPKLIDDGKKVRKKSWVPFVCCSSVNVVN